MKIVLWDLDGTLSNCEEFLHLIKTKPKNWDQWDNKIVDHTPYQDIVDLVHMHYNADHINIIVTARRESCRPQTIKWLEKHGILDKFIKIYMRPMKDFRPDFEVKKDILDELIRNGQKPDYVYEDRSSVVEMYRENGIRCFQVVNGHY